MEVIAGRDIDKRRFAMPFGGIFLSSPSDQSSMQQLVQPTFSEALRFWLKLGLISFGGPAGQISIMHEELVEKRRWVSEQQFLHALNFCMLLPGPEAQQLATYTGWLLHKKRGGLAAGALFVLPSMVLLWLLSVVYAVHGSVPWVAAIFQGLKAAVIAIVFSALIKIGKKALKNPVMWAIAALSFFAIYRFNVPFPIIIIASALIGFFGDKFAPAFFRVLQQNAVPLNNQTTTGNTIQLKQNAVLYSVKILFTGALLWWSPVLLAGLLLGWDSTAVQQGVFFSKAALVTFGGAYAVLPYVAQQAVETHQWLTFTQMMDGLGLAETTPGPLVMVVQHVGFMGGWNHPGNLSPMVSGTISALITTWVTFVPCFMFIFLGAPYIERLRGNESLVSALSAVTAAVVGVILNLGVWFTLHAVFPAEAGVDWFILLLAISAFIGLKQFNWPMIPVIASCGLLGLILG